MPAVNQECYDDDKHDVYDFIKEYTTATDNDVWKLVNWIMNSSEDRVHRMENICGYSSVVWQYLGTRRMIDIILRWEEK